MKSNVKLAMKSLVAVYSSVVIDFIGILPNITSIKIKPECLKAICCWHQ